MASDQANEVLNGHAGLVANEQHPQSHLATDSTTTQAEIIEDAGDAGNEPPHKKVKIGHDEDPPQPQGTRESQRGAAPVKSEYLVHDDPGSIDRHVIDDDAAEGRGERERQPDQRDKKRKKQKGQNKARTFGTFGEAKPLCMSRMLAPEFTPEECSKGDACKFEHDLRKYLENKPSDLHSFDAKCPVFEARGKCSAGFKCRYLSSHIRENAREDGRMELCLVEDHEKVQAADSLDEKNSKSTADGIVNEVALSTKIDLQKRRYPTPAADAFIGWLESVKGDSNDNSHTLDNRASYVEGALRPSEKRKLYFGRDTPALAPLTTQGNPPFRRLCVELGAQLTYSEMAMSLPLLNGHKGEWALMKAHESETYQPKFGATPSNVVEGYDNTKDLKFGAQISGNRPWNITKATEIITSLCPHLRLVDVNCGCPIDLVYDHGAGSALLDHAGKLEKMLMGMNAVSGEVPITCKIRMGTKDKHPTALKLVNRLAYGAQTDGPSSDVSPEGRTSGVAAITLHGRSRQQRYSRSADWEYISECAALINRYNREGDQVADTIREADPRDQPSSAKIFFLGNGDCYSHVDYYNNLENAQVDSIMIARGALVKPWLFEEIEKNQYLDKTATERLGYVERFVKYGLENWGSDEVGVSTTRRFLLEWLSFAHRYVPIGILEHLPPSLQDRPPRYKGRNELETLLSSDNYKDWIKISEMFLGTASEGFKFQPKHKSNS